MSNRKIATSTNTLIDSGITHFPSTDGLKKITITFAGLAGATPSSISPIVVYAGASVVNSPITPTRPNFRFIGWEPSLPASFMEDTVITPVFEDNSTYNSITYVTDGGLPELGTVRYVQNSTVVMPNVSKEGYNFIGWRNEYGTEVKELRITRDYTVYARFEPERRYGNFIGNGGLPANTRKSVIAPFDVTPPNMESRENYTFVGWKVGDTFVNFPYRMTEDTDFIAQWSYSPESDKITVSFNSNGGNYIYPVIGNSVSVTIQSSPVVTMAGHIFVGWRVNNVNVTFPYTAYTNTVMTAVWATETVKLSFDSAGGSLIPDVHYPKDSVVYLDDKVPTKDGDLFDGWLLNGNIVTSVIMTSDIMLTAKWTSSYVISFNLDGGTPPINSINKKENEVITIPNIIPNKVRHIFKNWADEDKIYLPSDAYSDNKSVELLAIWSEEFEVIYNVNGGTGEFLNQTKTEGEDLILHMNTPTKSGFVFGGWESSELGILLQAGGTYNVDSNVIFVAKWDELTYPVNYLTGGTGVTNMPSNSVKRHNIMYTIPSTVPIRTNYVFNRWIGSDGIYYTPLSTYTENKSLSLTAQWNKTSVKMQDYYETETTIDYSSYKLQVHILNVDNLTISFRVEIRDMNGLLITTGTTNPSLSISQSQWITTGAIPAVNSKVYVNVMGTDNSGIKNSSTVTNIVETVISTQVTATPRITLVGTENVGTTHWRGVYKVTNLDDIRIRSIYASSNNSDYKLVHHFLDSGDITPNIYTDDIPNSVETTTLNVYANSTEKPYKSNDATVTISKPALLDKPLITDVTTAAGTNNWTVTWRVFNDSPIYKVTIMTGSPYYDDDDSAVISNVEPHSYTRYVSKTHSYGVSNTTIEARSYVNSVGESELVTWNVTAPSQPVNKAAKPSISAYTEAETGGWRVKWRVMNLDTLTAGIFAGIGAYVQIGTVAWQQLTSEQTSSLIPYSTSSVLINAYARVSGKTDSDIDSKRYYAPPAPTGYEWIQSGSSCSGFAPAVEYSLNGVACNPSQVGEQTYSSENHACFTCTLLS